MKKLVAATVLALALFAVPGSSHAKDKSSTMSDLLGVTASADASGGGLSLAAGSSVSAADHDPIDCVNAYTSGVISATNQYISVVLSPQATLGTILQANNAYINALLSLFNSLLNCLGF